MTDRRIEVSAADLETALDDWDASYLNEGFEIKQSASVPAKEAYRRLRALLTGPDNLGPRDSGGIPIVMAVARDALRHHIDRRHPYQPRLCEGCEFTPDAMRRLLRAIKAYRE